MQHLNKTINSDEASHSRDWIGKVWSEWGIFLLMEGDKKWEVERRVKHWLQKEGRKKKKEKKRCRSYVATQEKSRINCKCFSF